MSIEKIIRSTRQHLTDSLSIVAVSVPLFSFLDNVVVGMSDEHAIKTRLIAAGICFGGIGGLLGYGRDLSKRALKITTETEERYQQLHDMTFMAASSLVLNPLLYLGSGNRDFKEIATGTALAVVVGFVSGGLYGYALDLFRDLTNYEASERIPPRIHNLPHKTKGALATGIVAVSIGSAGVIYHLTPDCPNDISNPTTKTEINVPYDE